MKALDTHAAIKRLQEKTFSEVQAEGIVELVEQNNGNFNHRFDHLETRFDKIEACFKHLENKFLAYLGLGLGLIGIMLTIVTIALAVVLGRS